MRTALLTCALVALASVLLAQEGFAESPTRQLLADAKVGLPFVTELPFL